MCGESRTHGLEGVVEGRPSTTTLRLKDMPGYSTFLIESYPFMVNSINK